MASKSRARSFPVEETAKQFGTAGMPQFAQGLGLDLPYSFARHFELFTDLLQGCDPGSGRCRSAYAAALSIRAATACSMPRGSPLATAARVVASSGSSCEVSSNRSPDMQVVVVADRSLNGDRVTGDALHAADLVLGEFHPVRQFRRRRLPSLFLHDLPGDAVDLVDGFRHVNRHPDRARLVGDGTG